MDDPTTSRALPSFRDYIAGAMHPLSLRGARTHHLKGVDLEIRPGELLVVTGISGAGKSSLAFDTLYSEGQRRFVESFSPYARQFLERLERPPMDSLEPVAAGVAVDRRAPIKSSRSTVATMADLEPFLGALFLRHARPLCPDCGALAERSDPSSSAAALGREHEGARALISYPVRVTGTEAYLELREQLLRDGYRRLVVGSEAAARDLDDLRPSEVLAAGQLDVLIDRVKVGARQRSRVAAALEEAWSRAEGRATLHLVQQGADAQRLERRRGLSCGGCGRSFAEPFPGLFSYQSPVGACPTCRGFGRVLGIDWHKVTPDPTVSLKRHAIRPWSGKKSAWERRMLRRFCEERGIPYEEPWGSLSKAQQTAVIEGEGRWSKRHYPGVRRWFQWLETKTYKMHVRVLLSRYRSYDPCTSCDGKRLSEASLMYRVDGLDLGEWHRLELADARGRLEALQQLSGAAGVSGQGRLAVDELVSRLRYLERVGLGYLTLDRQARSLSGGEAQRVSLTAALGTSLTGALFVLDEPTVGLHPSDVPPLVDAMDELCARGNAVVVIEHDATVIAAAERVVELGPGAGPHGGEVVFDGSVAQARRHASLATARALRPLKLAVADRPLDVAAGLTIVGARENNLRGADVHLPLGALVVVCGPSGSGKSTLVDKILYRALAQQLGDYQVEPPGAFERLQGGAPIRSVELVNQAPMGRTSRGNAATYTGAWTRVRQLLAKQPEAELRGLGPAHFSFNVAAGRCQACAGEGAETVEMQFLADVRLSCPVCHGKRFRDEVLDVRLHGHNAADLLEMTVDQALELFSLDSAIERALRPLVELGLDYLPLGQPLSTLSGGEAQRLKLARSMRTIDAGALLLVDEPSAGLHADEVDMLMRSLNRQVDRLVSVVVVDHDPRVIAAADWVIELGPGAGAAGGQLVFEGPLKKLRKGTTRTAQALRDASSKPSASKRRSRSRAPAPCAITVRGAREHNLRNVDADIPHGQLVVVTGPSGSGKSSLAFDVVFAEGQRRFMETLSPYARQFLPIMPRPDVDSVSGVPPAIALEQRTARAGATSTVATVTEIAHYLRLLFAKLGQPYCPDCEQPVSALAPDAVFAQLRRRRGQLCLRAPVVRGRKGSYLDVFSAADRAGIEWARVDGQVVGTDDPPRLRKTREHDIDLIVYEGTARALDRAAFDRGLAFARGQLIASTGDAHTLDPANDELLSTSRACPRCQLALPELDPRWFSFNTKQGSCAACEGTGVKGGPDAIREAEASVDEEVTLRPCTSCGGSRLAPIPRAVRLFGERYHQQVARSVSAMLAQLEPVRFAGDQALIGDAPLTELRRRLRFVDQVGLGYLTLDRRAATLSGGEMQRLRLAAQLGSGLTGALYVLDEPTIGLHPRDTGRLLDNLRQLVDMGSTVLVVEHDADTILAADYVLDMGPGGGRGGGRIIASGSPAEVLANPASPTGKALAERRAMTTARSRMPPAEHHLILRGVRAHNVAIDELRIPAQRMIVIAGVSGSGKSTLIGQVLYPAARRLLGRVAGRAGHHQQLELPSVIQRVIAVDQSPIGRTSRSVPATFLGVWDPIRRLFAASPEARTRGYKPARFSFNSAAAGGRCELCGGNGVIAHEMAFLPDVKTPCGACDGLRFEPSTLDIRYLGMNIGDVLRLTIDEAAEVFVHHRNIAAPLSTLRDLGVGYVQLGQGSPTLSGGEAQRLKLAKELTAGRAHLPTLYVLDEPTTGLHHSDVARLISVLDRLVQRGDSLLIIEHHPEVIACADHVIELGPEGGEQGGQLVAQGTPDEIAKAGTATGVVLRALL